MHNFQCSSTRTIKHWKWYTWHRKASAKNSSKFNKFLAYWSESNNTYSIRFSKSIWFQSQRFYKAFKHRNFLVWMYLLMVETPIVSSSESKLPSLDSLQMLHNEIGNESPYWSSLSFHRPIIGFTWLTWHFRGKWPLARNIDRSWWYYYTSLKLFWPHPKTPWRSG